MKNYKLKTKPSIFSSIDEIDSVTRLFLRPKDNSEFQSPYDFIKIVVLYYQKKFHIMDHYSIYLVNYS